ncbi:MAG: S8 family serine peptidase, partial [Phycisphaerales bacterium]
MHRSMLIAACGLALAAGTPELLAQVPDLGGPLVGEGLAEAWWVEDEFVVRLSGGVDRLAAMQANDSTGRFGLKALDRTLATAGVVSMRQLFPGSHQPGIAAADPAKLELCGYWVVRIDRGVIDLDSAMRIVSRDPSVEAVEPIGVHPVAQSGPLVPNDPSFGSQWYLNQGNDADIDAVEGWSIASGNPSVIVAVADTGVRYYHRDLGGSSGSPSNPFGARGNLWINQAEANGTAGVDDDGNGFVDDVVGWDFVSDTSSCTTGEDCSGADNDPRDFDGHGTHCAGIVAAITNNGTGVASPAGGWNSGSLAAEANGVRIMSLRIGWDPGYIRMDFAASAMYYAANQGARIISCSWGSSNSGGLGAATTYFINAGGMVFTAAGNSNNQTASYLAGRSDVWSVASTANNDVKSSFSSYGSWVDISAPGSSIYSTYHNSGSPNSDVYASLSGTSMATPLVASVAATVWAANPSLNAAQVWAHVRDSADNIDALNPSYLGLLGSGRVNLQSALLAAGGGGGGGGPVNDECTGAIALAEGSTPFDTTSASDSAPALPAACDDGYGTSI